MKNSNLSQLLPALPPGPLVVVVCGGNLVTLDLVKVSIFVLMMMMINIIINNRIIIIITSFRSGGDRTEFLMRKSVNQY